MNKIFIRAYAPRVFAISAGTGVNFNRIIPDKTDVLSLCKAILEVDDNVSDSTFIRQEKDRYIHACKASQILSGYPLDKGAIEFAAPASLKKKALPAIRRLRLVHYQEISWYTSRKFGATISKLK